MVTLRGRLVASLALLVIAKLIAGGIKLYTDWRWFDSLGFSGAHGAVIFTQASPFLIGASVFAIGYSASLLLARFIYLHHLFGTGRAWLPVLGIAP